MLKTKNIENTTKLKSQKAPKLVKQLIWHNWGRYNHLEWKGAEKKLLKIKMSHLPLRLDLLPVRRFQLNRYGLTLLFI